LLATDGAFLQKAQVDAQKDVDVDEVDDIAADEFEVVEDSFDSLANERAKSDAEDDSIEEQVDGEVEELEKEADEVGEAKPKKAPELAELEAVVAKKADKPVEKAEKPAEKIDIVAKQAERVADKTEKVAKQAVAKVGKEAVVAKVTKEAVVAKKIIPHMPGEVDKQIVAEKTEKVAQKVTKKADKLAVTSPPLTKEHLTQKMPLESQEQGFEGEMVQHEDGKSMVTDWRREYGPKTTSNTKHEKSSSTRCGLASAVVIAAALHFWQ